MTDKQYDGVLKSAIHALDRVAEATTDKDVLRNLFKERNNFVSMLGYPVDEQNLYDSIK